MPANPKHDGKKRKKEPWECPRCGLLGEHLKVPAYTQQCLECCTVDVATELRMTLEAILPLAESYLKNAPSDPDNAKLEDARSVILKARGEGGAMNSPKHDGGPVYPMVDHVVGPEGRTVYVNGGMSLRDYFAGQALAAYLNQHEGDWPGDAAIAERVYFIADAMLAAREKNNG